MKETINSSSSPDSALLQTILSQMDTLSTDVEAMNDNMFEMKDDIKELKDFKTKLIKLNMWLTMH